MNAQSYLQSYGWTPGSSLGNPLSHDSTTSAPRLTKRILTSAKNNTHGVGRKASNLNHADLWWEKAFDVSLKKLDVNKDTSAIKKEEKAVVDNMNLFADLGGGRGFGGTAVANVGQGKGAVQGITGSLQRYFVSGGLLEGTISIATTTTTKKLGAVEPESDNRPSKKRKREDSSKSERKAEKEAKAAAKIERKRLRAERRAAKVERRRLRAEKKASKEEKKKMKAEKTSTKDEHQQAPEVQSDSGVDLSRDATPIVESKVKASSKTEDEEIKNKKSKRKTKKSSSKGDKKSERKAKLK